MTRHFPQAAVVGIYLASSVVVASAQSAVYVTGTGFADLKSFSETESDPSPGQDDSGLDGTAAGGGLRIGTFLHPRWSLELAIDVGGKTDGPAPYAIILTDLPSSSRISELKDSVRFLTISGVVGFHPAPHGRFHLGYFFGFSFVRSTFKSQYPDYYTLAAGGSGGTGTIVRPTIFPPPVFNVETITFVDNTSAAILGFEAAVDLGKHFALVPEIRALAFSPGNGAGVFLIRPGVGLRWNF